MLSWLFNRRDYVRRDLRILAHGNLILIERLRAMSAQTEALAQAVDALLAKYATVTPEAVRLQSENDALKAQLDEANAAMLAATARIQEAGI